MSEAKCPFPHEAIRASSAVATGQSKAGWWPEAISLDALNENFPKDDPLGKDFDYAEEFAKLNIQDVKEFIYTIMTNSGPRFEEFTRAGNMGAMPYGQEYWWPADWGNYGPLFIRLAWHSAGTYRTSDGRGGAGQGLIRFAPLNSWPDNVNLDKARRILWPVKERYGNKISWADLMILAGNVALESMGLKTIGFAGGREDSWGPDNTYWGSEKSWLANERYREGRKLDEPLAAVQMGLIYVNPEGPDGDAEDFSGSAKDIRETFKRMGMDDEETVALIAGGHAFGKAHGAGDPSQLGPEPEAAPVEHAGLGWINPQGKGHSEDTITSGLEGAWTPTPLQWDNRYLEILYKYDWEKVLSPAGAQQWTPIDCEESDMVADAHIPNKMNKPMMLTTDLALRFGDEEYNKICEKFLKDFDYFSDSFAKAWFKLTHRDMGPKSRYLGPEVPKETFIWQDPLSATPFPQLSDGEMVSLRQGINDALDTNDIALQYNRGQEVHHRNLDLRDLIFTAWVSASTYRKSDKRGGANGARILLEPMKSWEFVDHERVSKVVDMLLDIKESLNIKMSNADLIVFAAGVAIERAAKNANRTAHVEFVGGRVDAIQEEIDAESFGHLEPIADGFLNWTKTHMLPQNGSEEHSKDGPEAAGVTMLESFSDHLMIDRAALLSLTPKEMVALFTGLRSMGVHHRNSTISSVSWNRNSGHKLNSDFLENLVLKPWYLWAPSDIESPTDEGFSGTHQHPNQNVVLRASRVDLMFSSQSTLRAIAEFYASDPKGEGEISLINDFVQAWTKVMMLDRFDIRNRKGGQ